MFLLFYLSLKLRVFDVKYLKNHSFARKLCTSLCNNKKTKKIQIKIQAKYERYSLIYIKLISNSFYVFVII